MCYTYDIYVHVHWLFMVNLSCYGSHVIYFSNLKLVNRLRPYFDKNRDSHVFTDINILIHVSTKFQYLQ